MNLANPTTCPVLAGRDWRWFLVRWSGLTNTPDSRLFRALLPERSPA